ncbi:MAG: BREX-1 system adenine-specific DNA-methyltransferase PglX, partial [Chloroflexales bacterium]
MDDTLRAQLHDLALNARRLLTEETRSVISAVYGLSSDGRFEPLTKLPAVQALTEAAETRRRLERFIRDEAAAGRKGAEAVERLVRETAFTHLNRLVAFKLLEARKLIRGTLDKSHAANGFLFYVNDHPEDNVRYAAGDMPKDALEEGPRDIAYRHFLLWQAAQLAREVPVLFDPANLPSRLFPRPRTLRTLLDMLNAPELREAWAVGNEETIGWVYQYFNEEEKDAVFVRLNKSKQKIRREDLPAATQLFTPRWIVRFLVENTLGRQWMQMHPDSRLGADLAYLVPLAGEIPAAPLKPVRELTLLDPACGTMHFGLVAFDLFAAMYREELEHAGESGWPARPSVEQADDIPAAILANNLFGIDIDLRAVQLAALSLYVRAKALSPKATVTPRNLVCADVTVLNGNRLGAFVDALGHTKPEVEAAIRALWPRLKQAGELGSLLRLEADMRSLFVTSRARKAQQGIMSLPGYEDVDAGQFRTTDLDAAVRAALNTFARQEAERGDDATTFVAGAEQGLKLLDLLARRYDIVVANPPYMSVRGMPATLADFIKTAYPEGKGDLYAAFIQRCAQLLATGGRLGMIAQQSFMFISSYEKLREQLRGTTAIETMAHVGPRAFAEIGGEKVNTTLFALRREGNESRRQDSVGTYFRLVREPDAEAKQVAFERAVGVLNHRGTEAQSIFCYRQGDFEAIPGGPWVYWVTAKLRRLFVDLPKLDEIAPAIHGTATYDNFRFLRFWWEMGKGNVAFTSRSWGEFEKSGRDYAHYMMVGSFRRRYGDQEYVVQLLKQGRVLVQFLSEKRDTIRGQNAIFRKGITWSDLTQGRFAARLSPGGFIFDVKGSSAFPSEDKIPLVLALLNSEFAHYALNLLNPTISFQVGDLARLPIPTRTSETLNGLVERAIALAKEDSTESETTYDFVAPPAWQGLN